MRETHHVVAALNEAILFFAYPAAGHADSPSGARGGRPGPRLPNQPSLSEQPLREVLKSPVRITGGRKNLTYRA
jgi:hypothetical protein